MSERAHLLLFVHGLYYDGSQLSRLFKSPPPEVDVVPFTYGLKDWRYLFSSEQARELTDKLYLEVRRLKATEKYASVNILAHSLGTQITMGAFHKYTDFEVDTVFMAAAIVDPGTELPLNRPKTFFVNYVSDDDPWLIGLPLLAAVLNRLRNLPLPAGPAGRRGLAKTGVTVINRRAPRSGHDGGATQARVVSDVLTLLHGTTRRRALQRLLSDRQALSRDLLIPGRPEWKYQAIIPRGLLPISYRTASAPTAAKDGKPTELSDSQRQGLILVEGAAGVGKTTALMSIYSRMTDELIGDEAIFLPTWVSWKRVTDLEAARRSVADAAADLEDFADRVHVFIDGIDERECDAETWRGIQRWSQEPQVQAIWVSGRPEKAYESIPSEVLSGFSDHITILGMDKVAARALLDDPAATGQRINPGLADEILSLPIVQEGKYFNPLRIFMARLLVESGVGAGASAMSNPFAFFQKYTTLSLSRTEPREGYSSGDGLMALHALALSIHEGKMAQRLPAPIVAWVSATWTDLGAAVERTEFVSWAGSLPQAGFKHFTFAEYYLVDSAFTALLDLGDDERFDLLLKTPMHESLAGFVKGRLSGLPAASKTQLISRLRGQLETLLSRGEALSSDGDTALLNGTVYMASRIGHGAETILADLWDRRERILQASPETFATVLSGISLLDMMELEAAYFELALADEAVLRVLIGWHLVYYGDREKPANFKFGNLNFLIASGGWSRTRAALETRMASSDVRERSLFGFHALAYVSCAKLLTNGNIAKAAEAAKDLARQKEIAEARLNAIMNMIDRLAA